MPRVGGGGGPVIPPQSQGSGPAGPSNQVSKTDFASKVSQSAAETTGPAPKSTPPSQLTGKAKEIAKRFAAGKLSQKQATREFVGLIIEERFPQFKKKKKKKSDDKDDNDKGDDTSQDDDGPEERLEEAVTELIDRDPTLAKRLSNQFKKLAKG